MSPRTSSSGARGAVDASEWAKLLRQLAEPLATRRATLFGEPARVLPPREAPPPLGQVSPARDALPIAGAQFSSGSAPLMLFPYRIQRSVA